jgi:NADH-quinone oxidoreductase subunit N
MQILDLRPLIPALIVAATGLVILLVQAFVPERRAPFAVPLSLFGLIAALGALLLPNWEGPCGACAASTGGSLSADPIAVFLEVVLLLIGMAVVLLSPSYLRETEGDRGEYYTLVLFSLVGMLGLVASLELISLFVALEIMSVALYALCGSARGRMTSQESAIKYFITGSFSSAFLLYGVALLYGASGSTMLARIAPAVAQPPAGMELLPILGLGMMLVGFAFKVATAPFHAWAPDVYEGAPTPVTAFMAAGVKAAAFGALLRVLAQAVPGLADHWRPAIAALAIVTMLIGNLGALAQSSVKRMLAYSSIAHAGYLLAALVAAREVAGEAILFYLVGYAAVNLGGFGAMAALARNRREPLTLADFNGLAERRPALAAALTVFLLSLTGIPVSAGFVGKFYLFTAAVGAGYAVLAVVGMLTSVISAYYYLRVVVAMYMHEPAAGEDPWAPIGFGAGAALAAMVAVVLTLGVYPAPLLALARAAARAL